MTPKIVLHKTKFTKKFQIHFSVSLKSVIFFSHLRAKTSNKKKLHRIIHVIREIEDHQNVEMIVLFYPVFEEEYVLLYILNIKHNYI